MVERFNGRISEVIQQTRFTCAAELETTLMNYQTTYNHHPPSACAEPPLTYRSFTKLEKKVPNLFVKRVYKQAELDS